MRVKGYELHRRLLTCYAPILPSKVSDRGRKASGDPLSATVMLCLLRSGSHWVFLAERYDRFESFDERPTRRLLAGVCERAFADLSRVA